ncbi:FHA domain-containing protein [Kitasatospora sp. NPDC052896]|uniref:FHA domain-containing protein n=1 Tax=Kitasatospora sp. NPDC052896 TaxID=3364061 RepID=UPI0037C8C81F
MPFCPRGHESQSEDWCDFCGFPMNAAGGQAPAGAPAGGPYGAPPPPPPPMPPHGMPGHPMPGSPLPGATEGLVTCPICRTPQTGRYCEECGYDYELTGAGQPGGGYGYPQPPAQMPQPPAQQPGGGYGYPQPPAPGYPAAPPAPGGYPPPPPVPGPPPGQPQPPQGSAPDPFGTSFRLAPPEPPAARTSWVAVVSADRDYFTDMMARSGPEASGLFFPPYCPERRIPLTGRGQLRIGRRSQHRGTVPEIDLSVPPEDPGASHQHALLAEQPDGSWVLVDQDSTNGTTMNGGADPVTPHTAIPLNDGDRIHIGAWTTITLHRA